MYRSLVVAILLARPAALGATEPATDIDTFRRASLLNRFDGDRDGKLNRTERSALREAFGGADVPMLPDRDERYVGVDTGNRPDDSTLKPTDNTPDDNPTTDAGARLGRVLFYDRQLSRNNTVACASCHPQDRGFSDPRRLSVGFLGGHTTRNAMGLVNLRYSNLRSSRPGFFWDERAATLEQQALMPIQDEVEMGMTLPELEARLGKLPYYPPLFDAAFGSTDITSDKVAKAIAQFLRAIESWRSKFDIAAGDAGSADYSRPFEKFDELENRGKSLFIDGVAGVAEVGCAHCHIPPTFAMPKAFNNGLDLHYSDQGLGARDVPSNDVFTADNNGKFKAPSLRNVAVTAPYMHDGRFETLEQVLDHYSSGVKPHPNVGLVFNTQGSSDEEDAASGFALTDDQKKALLAFLKTLTDEAVLKDGRFSDPFVRNE